LSTAACERRQNKFYFDARHAPKHPTPITKQQRPQMQMQQVAAIIQSTVITQKENK